MFGLFELGFFDPFGCPIETCVPGLNFVYTAKTASSNLFQNRIIFKVVPFLHLDKLIPLYLNFLNFPQIFYRIDSRLLLVVLDLPIFGLMGFIVNLGKDFQSLDLDRSILFDITFDGMDIEEICFWGKSACPWFIG